MGTAPYTEAIAGLLEIFHANESFVITSHARPDGDAIGSSLGMMHLLDEMGKKTSVAFADPIPEIYKEIPGIERITRALPDTRQDVAILLECDSIGRTGFTQINALKTVNIDHHLSGRPFADCNWIDPTASAVGAMVYDLAVASGLPITPAMATCLYTAVITDTGSFTFASTTAKTFAMASHLLQNGADHNGVVRAMYFSNSPEKMRLLAVALDRMEIEGPVAWSFVTQADMQSTGAAVEDCEGIVNYLIGIAGICAAAFLREQPGGNDFRLSLRSKNPVNVAEIASRFAGGGHRNASGGTVAAPLEEAIRRLVSELQAACRPPA